MRRQSTPLALAALLAALVLAPPALAASFDPPKEGIHVASDAREASLVQVAASRPVVSPSEGPLAPEARTGEARVPPASEGAAQGAAPGATLDAAAREGASAAPVMQLALAEDGGLARVRQDPGGVRTLLLLPGSDLVLPLGLRELPEAPRPIPLSPAQPGMLTPAEPREPAHVSRDAPAAEEPAPRPSRSQVAAPAAPADPPASWPEQAAYAGAALVLVLAPFLLYHRLRGATLLHHEPRARIMELLRARPGMTPTELARELQVDPSTALYHLRRLVKDSLVTPHGERRGARYFATGSVPPAERDRLVFARHPSGLLDAIRSTPGVSKTTLAERLDIARATLHWHLARLERAGLVRYQRAGREVKVFPSQETFSPGPA